MSRSIPLRFGPHSKSSKHFRKTALPGLWFGTVTESTAIPSHESRRNGHRSNSHCTTGPWQNGYVERVIGSVRRECLNHVIVFNDNHLRRLLKDYFRYYHESRTHLSLNK